MNTATAVYLLDINVVLHTAAELVVPPDGMHTVPVAALKVRQREDRVLVRFDDGKHEQEIDYTGKALIVYHRNSPQREEEDALASALYVLWETQQHKEEADKDYSLVLLMQTANDLHDFSYETSIAEYARYNWDAHESRIYLSDVWNFLDKWQLRTQCKSGDQLRRPYLIWDHERIEGIWQRYNLGDNEEREILMNVHQEIQQRIIEHEAKCAEVSARANTA